MGQPRKPDWWGMKYLGNPNQTADGDYDGDGVDKYHLLHLTAVLPGSEAGLTPGGAGAIRFPFGFRIYGVRTR
jgi:hypothetical protein